MSCEEFANAFGETVKMPNKSKHMYSGNLAILVRYIYIITVLVDRFIDGDIIMSYTVLSAEKILHGRREGL